MSAILINCDNCHRRYAADRRFLFTEVRCRNCGRQFVATPASDAEQVSEVLVNRGNRRSSTAARLRKRILEERRAWRRLFFLSAIVLVLAGLLITPFHLQDVVIPLPAPAPPPNSPSADNSPGDVVITVRRNFFGRVLSATITKDSYTYEGKTVDDESRPHGKWTKYQGEDESSDVWFSHGKEVTKERWHRLK